MTNGKPKFKKDVSKCVCRLWTTGGLDLHFIKDAADGHVLEVEATGPFPDRLAVSSSFATRMNKHMPGMAEIQGSRLIIRTTKLEHAYKRAGVCPGCGYVLLQSEGAG